MSGSAFFGVYLSVCLLKNNIKTKYNYSTVKDRVQNFVYMLE